MTTYKHTRRVARISHQCMLCARQIGPGETYLHGVGLDNGAAWTWKECAHCDALRSYVYTHHWDDHYDEELIYNWEPQTVAHLRLKAMWRRQWRRVDGTLMPVPVVVRTEDPHGFSAVTDICAGEQ